MLYSNLRTEGLQKFGMGLPSTSGGTVEAAAARSDVKKPTKKICCACPETKVRISVGLFRFWGCKLVKGDFLTGNFVTQFFSFFISAEGKRRVYCAARSRIRTVQVFN